MTNGATVTNAQGFFGANLKYSGYDAIVLQGQANRWVYVYINDDLVELRDASHLLGKDTWDMQDAPPGGARTQRPPDERLRHRPRR